MANSTPPNASPRLQQKHLGKHLSKSASELNGHERIGTAGNNQSAQDLEQEYYAEDISPRTSPKRAKSAAAAIPAGSAAAANTSSGIGVFQKTHGFFNNLKHRWSRARSKDRVGRKSPSDFLEESTDYAADYSSESSSVNQSPRKVTTIGGSPLAKEFKATAKMAQVIQRFGGSMEGRIDEDTENGATASGGMAFKTASSMDEYSAQKQLNALQVNNSNTKYCHYH